MTEKTDVIAAMAIEKYEQNQTTNKFIRTLVDKAEGYRLEVVALESKARVKDREYLDIYKDLEEAARDLLAAYEIDPEMEGKVQERRRAGMLAAPKRTPEEAATENQRRMDQLKKVISDGE